MSVIANDLRVQRKTWTLADLLASPRFFWLIVALYLVAHIALRLWETPNVAKNDVQEAVAAQVWAWGYHPRNPPLHTWLLMSSYSVFGVRLLAHVVLKYALIAVTLGFAYLCGRRLLSNASLAALSALSLTLLAPFAWTAHTALTHTLLLAAMNLGTLWAAIRLSASHRTADYALLGVMIALGFLAKYSFALFLLPLLAAMLTQTELRRVILDWRIFITLGVALLIFGPHGLWMLDARFDFVQFLSEKQQSEDPQPYLVEVAKGLGAVVIAALSFLVPLLLVFPLAFRRAFKTEALSDASPWARATTLIVVFGLALLVLDVFVLRATQFEQRYMMCALMAAPLAAFLWLDRRNPSQQSLTGFVVATALVAGVVFAGITGRAMLEHRSCNRCWEEMPIGDFARELRQSGFIDGTIVADHYNVAGNMRLAFPDSRIVAANYFVAHPDRSAEGQCLLVWNARNAGEAMPQALLDYLAWRGLSAPAAPPDYFTAPLRRSERLDRFGYVFLANTDGNCRAR